MPSDPPKPPPFRESLPPEHADAVARIDRKIAEHLAAIDRLRRERAELYVVTLDRRNEK